MVRQRIPKSTRHDARSTNGGVKVPALGDVGLQRVDVVAGCVALVRWYLGLVLSCGPGSLASFAQPGLSFFLKRATTQETGPYAGIPLMAELWGSGVVWLWYALVVGLIFLRIV